MVAMRHINDDEILDFARLSQRLPLQMRFIEFMPIGVSSRWNADTYISTDEIMARIGTLAELIPLQKGRNRRSGQGLSAGRGRCRHSGIHQSAQSSFL